MDAADVETDAAAEDALAAEDADAGATSSKHIKLKLPMMNTRSSTCSSELGRWAPLKTTQLI